MAEDTAVASAPVAQMQNCQKLSSVERDTSSLHKNIADKGTNAYYYAHSRSYEIPAHAKIITGPGLVAGGPPQKLDGPDGAPSVEHGTALAPQAAAMAEDAASEGPASPLKDIELEALALKEYSWSDDGAKVKVYVPCDALPSDAGLVNANFESKGVSIDIATVPRRRFRLDKLNKEIEPKECKFKADAAKGRITITLVKKRGGAWYDLVSKK